MVTFARDGLPRWQALLALLGMVALAALGTYVFARFFAIFLLIFAGVLLAVFLHGTASWLAVRTRLSYGGGLAVVSVVLFGLLVGFAVALGAQIASRAGELTREVASAGQWLRESLPDDVRLEDLFGSGAGSPMRFVSTALGAVGNVVIVLFVGLYLAAGHRRYKRGIAKLFPPARRPRVEELLQRTGATLTWWLMGRIVSMTFIGVATTLGLWAMGIPMPLVLGVLAGILSFIPNLGPILALAPAVLLALRIGPGMAVGVVAFYTGLQIVESYLLLPWIDKRSISMPPAMTIVAQLLLGAAGGLVGLAVAAPIMAVTLVVVNELYVQDVLGDDRALAGTAPRPVYEESGR